VISSRHRSGLLVGVAITLLMTAWVFSTFPYGGPDEGAHYLRALSIANGVLVGRQHPFHGLYWPAYESAYVSHDNRLVTVPAALSPGTYGCLDGKLDLVGSCREATYVGDYPPLPYLLPAVAIKASGTSQTAWWLGRLLSALLNLAFILLALVFVVRGFRGSRLLLAFVMALTPMVFFVSSIISPNGLEIASNFAFFAGILWALRDPRDVPRWALVATAVSGVVVLLAWSLGPAIVVINLVVASLLTSRRRLTELLHRHRRAITVTASCLVLALIVYYVYGKTSGLLHAGLQLHGIWNALWTGRHEDGIVLRDAVGVFGGLSVPLPGWMKWLWWALVAVLCAVAIARSGRRGRIAMVLTLVIVLAFPIFFWAFYFRQVTGLQGRYVLPILVLAPLVAGYLLARDVQARAVPSRVERAAIGGAIALVAVLQGLAWWINARAYAGNTNAHSLLSRPRWSPPLGWLPWIVLAALGMVALLGAAGLEVSGHRAVGAPDAEARGSATRTPVASGT
jgi:hypothetical protein